MTVFYFWSNILIKFFLSILIKNKTFEQYSVNDRELTQFPQNFIL